MAKRKAHENHEYLAWLRTLPCWGCYAPVYFVEARGFDLMDSRFNELPKRFTEAAHIGSSTTHRGLSQKVPDIESIPLCAMCHREGQFSIHKIGPRRFFALHLADRDEVIQMFQKMYAEREAWSAQ